jgi:hypothetical protein
MSSQDMLKNPILIGLLAAIATYSYIYWQEDQRYKKNPKTKKKRVNIITPGVVGALVWFIIGSYFDEVNMGPMIQKNTVIEKLSGGVELDTNGSQDSFGSKSYRLVGKGRVQLPQQDVFLDLANW